jgi:hypothetical protein
LQHYGQDGCGKSVGEGTANRQEAVSLYAVDGGRIYLTLAERQRALGTMATLDPD